MTETLFPYMNSSRNPEEWDIYQIVGTTYTLGIDMSMAELKKLYRRRALDTHPDRNPDDPKAEEKFQQLQDAFTWLSDENNRILYHAKIQQILTRRQQSNLDTDTMRQMKLNLEQREKKAQEIRQRELTKAARAAATTYDAQTNRYTVNVKYHTINNLQSSRTETAEFIQDISKKQSIISDLNNKDSSLGIRKGVSLSIDEKVLLANIETNRMNILQYEQKQSEKRTIQHEKRKNLQATMNAMFNKLS